MAAFQAQEKTFHYWWVKQAVLLAGPTPAACDRVSSRQFLRFLLDAGVRTFISLQEEDELIRKDNPFYHDRLALLAETLGVETACFRVPITDGTTLNAHTLRLVLDMMDSSIGQGKPVYVHCMEGHGRTGTVMGCWLVRHGLSGEGALRCLRDLRATDTYLASKRSPQQPAQDATVKGWVTGQ